MYNLVGRGSFEIGTYNCQHVYINFFNDFGLRFLLERIVGFTSFFLHIIFAYVSCCL